MGKLVDGIWHDVWYETKASNGSFEREHAGYRNWVTPDGSPGTSGIGGFPAAKGRYHLYVSLACPWAHRTLIFRACKGLTDFISVSVVHHAMGAQGWTFAEGNGVIADPEFAASYLHQIYTATDANYTGRVTVPVLWDKERQRPIHC